MPPERARGAPEEAPRDVPAAGEQLDRRSVGHDLLLLDDRQACRVHGVSRATWWKLHAQGRIPLPVRLGRRTLWRRKELECWVDASCPPRANWRWPAPPTIRRRP